MRSARIKRSDVLTGDVLPGVGVGTVRLGMGLEDVQKLVVLSDKRVALSGSYKVVGKGAEYWFSDVDDTLTQIMVVSPFEGALLSNFKLGSFLAQLQWMGARLETDEDNNIVCANLPGVCFSVGERDAAEEGIERLLGRRLDSICVFRA